MQEQTTLAQNKRKEIASASVSGQGQFQLLKNRQKPLDALHDSGVLRTNGEFISCSLKRDKPPCHFRLNSERTIPGANAGDMR